MLIDRLRKALPLSADTLTASNLGTFFFYSFSFFAFLGTGGANFSLLLSFLCLIHVYFVQGRRFVADKTFVLAGLFIIYVMLRTAMTQFEGGYLTREHLIGAFPWLLLWFPMVSFWLQDEPVRKTLIMLTLAMLGLLLDTFFYSTYHFSDLFQSVQQTSPYVFGGTAAGTGLIFMTAILGLALFFPRCYRSWRKNKRKALYSVVYFATVLAFIQALLLTHSRGSWLSIGIILPLCLLFLFWPTIKSNPVVGKRYLAGMVAIACLLAFTIYSNRDILEQRFGIEHEVYYSLLKGDLDSIPIVDSSIGQRVQIYRYGVNLWLQKPVFGWGTFDSRWLTSTHSEPLLQRLPHFHNVVLEILIHFGLVGLFLVSLAVFYLVRNLTKAQGEGRVPRDIFLFLVGTLGLFFLWGLGSTRITHVDWRYIWLMVAGSGYVLGVVPRSTSDSNQQ